MGPLIRNRPHPHMCRRMADMWPEKSATPENGQKWGPKFGPYLGVWVGWCAWWVHILYLAPDDERHPYRLSIHGSVDFGPCVLVTTYGTCFRSTLKLPFWANFAILGPKRRFLRKIQLELSCRALFVRKNRRYEKFLKFYKLSENFQKKGLE